MSYRKLTEKEKQHLSKRINEVRKNNIKLVKSDKEIKHYAMSLIDYHLKSAIEIYDLEISSKHER